MFAARRQAQLIWLGAAIVLGGLAAATPAQAALCNYQGGPGEDWHHATSDWSCGVFPDGDDDVVLDGTDNVAISSQDEAAKTLTTAAGTIIAFSTKTLNVGGAWNTTGGFIRNGGTVHVGGAFTKTDAGQLQLRGSTVILDAASSISGGSICVGVGQDGDGFMELNQTFSVLAGADAIPFPNCGNNGRIRINGPNGRFLKDSPGTSAVNRSFDNDDTVEIAQGDLTVGDGQGVQQDGQWIVPALHSLRFTGGFNSISGSVNSAGTVGVDGGTLSLADGGAFQSAATEIAGGTLDAQGTGTATTGSLLLDTGTRSGTRTFTTGSFDARAGSLKPGNTVATGTFTKTTAGALELRGGTLTLNGTSSISGGHICVGFFQDGDGFMEIGGSFSILDGAEAAPFPNCGNLGRIRINAPNGHFKKDSAGTSIMGQGFDNDDTVEVVRGELDVNAGDGGNLQDGAWLVPTGTVLSFGGGAGTLTGSGSITGAGTLRSAGGSVVLGDGGTYQVTTTEVVGGTLSIDGTTGTATTDSLLLTGGARGGARTFTVGSMDAQAGALRAAGPTVVTGAFTKTTAASLDLRGATLTLNGPSSLDAGHICVGVNQDGNGILLVGGTLTLAEASEAVPLQDCGNTSNVTIQGPDGRLQIAGTAAKTISSVTGNAGGTLAVGAGQTLTLTSPTYAQTAGATTVAASGDLGASPSLGGGTITVDGTVGGAVSLSNGAVLRGGGTVTGNVTNAGAVVRPGGSPGHLSVAGSYTQDATGALDVEIEGTGQGTTYDWLDVTGSATIDGTLNVLRPTGFAPAGSDVFQFLTSAGRSGTFATLTGADLPGGAAFTLDYPAGAPFGARLVVDLPPAPTPGQPTISGTPASGQTLTCNTGTWTDVTAFAFQWLRDGGAIGGATQQTYAVVDADRGHALSCRVTGSNAAGDAEATSAAVHVPAPPVEEPPAERPPAEQPPAPPPPAPIVTVPPPPPPPADTATPQEVRLATAAPAVVAQALGLPKRACLSRRRFTIRLREPAGVELRSARVTVGTKRITARRRNGRMTAIVDLRGFKPGRYPVKIIARTVSGKTLTGTRRYETCGKVRRRGGVPEL
jgi:hypothetical protein